MAQGSPPVEIFCCDAREDEVWLRQLETHLSLLRRQGHVSVWHDRLIIPGTNWQQTVDQHLEKASVILLLVSSDSFPTLKMLGARQQYCWGYFFSRAKTCGHYETLEGAA